MKTTFSCTPRSAKGAVDGGEAELERQRDVVGEDQRRGPGAALAAVDRDEVGARPVVSICGPARPEPDLADRDLMPTGRPVASASRSMKSSIEDTS
jgi:hypothetical protein